MIGAKFLKIFLGNFNKILYLNLPNILQTTPQIIVLTFLKFFEFIRNDLKFP